jgi:hypothetical protein
MTDDDDWILPEMSGVLGTVFPTELRGLEDKFASPISSGI